MEREWSTLAKLRVHWDYVINPIPFLEAARRFPDYNGADCVRLTVWGACRVPCQGAAGCALCLMALHVLRST